MKEEIVKIITKYDHMPLNLFVPYLHDIELQENGGSFDYLRNVGYVEYPLHHYDMGLEGVRFAHYKRR